MEDSKFEASIEVGVEGADKARKEGVGAMEDVAEAAQKAGAQIGDALSLDQIVTRMKKNRGAIQTELQKMGNVLKHAGVDPAKVDRDVEDATKSALKQFDAQPLKNAKVATDQLMAENKRATDAYARDWDAALKENERRNKEAAARTTAARAEAHNKEQRELTENARFAAKTLEDRVKAENAAAAQYSKDWDAAHKENAKREAAITKKIASMQAEQAKIIKKHDAEVLQSSATSHNQRVKEERILANATLASAKSRMRAETDYVNSLSNTRYALYDVARTYTMISIAAAAATTVPLVAAAQQEQAFASVARTVGAVGKEADDLRQQLVDMTTEMPVAFSDLAGIATLAGQLGIAKESVEDFTEVVAQFAATTNVSVEEAAKNIGRVAQLTGTPGTEYQNLAASIYEVGVTSVATESEILSMMSSIATAGDLAGFTNKQIIALSGAFASLGVQPEAARGSLQRIFNTITVGAESGGEALTRLAEISGMTESQISQLWKTDSQQVFTAFVQGLRDMDAEGTNTTETLKDIGINAVRDQRALQVLANNMDVYTQALGNADSAYANGTALQEGYAQQTDTVVAVFERLKSAVTATFAEIGKADGGALKAFLGVLLELTTRLMEFVQTPVGQAMSVIALATGGVVAAIAGYLAIQAKMQGAMYGMVTTAEGVAAVNGKVKTSLFGLGRQLLQTSVAYSKGTLDSTRFAEITGRVVAGVESETVALQRNTAAVNQNAIASSRMTLSERARATATGVATVATNAGTVAAKGLAAAFRFAGPLLAVSAALAVVTKGIELFTEARKSASEKATDFLGDTSGYQEALRKDLAVYQETGKAYSTFQADVEKSSTTLAPWAKKLSEAADAQVSLGDATSETTKNTVDQTFAIGENVEALTRKMLAENEKIQNAFKNTGGTLSGLGLDFQKFFDLAAQDPQEGLKYVDDFIAGLEARKKAATAAATPIGRIATQTEQNEIAAIAKSWDNSISAANQFRTAVNSVAVSIDDQARNVNLMNLAFAGTSDATRKAAGLLEEVDDGADGATDKIQELKNELLGLSSAMSGMNDTNSGYATLFDSLFENGTGFDLMTEEGRSNFSALEGLYSNMVNQFAGDNEALGTNIIGLMGTLALTGEGTADQIGFLQQALNSTLGPQWNLYFDPSQGLAGIFATIDAAVEAQKALLNLDALRKAAEAPVQYSQGQTAGDYAQQRANAAVADYNAAQKQSAALDRQAEQAKENVRKGLEQYNNSLDKFKDKQGNATKATKANNKATEEAVVTYEDYANTVKSVVDRMNNLIFGVDDAKAKVKSIANEIDVVTGKTKDAAEAVWNFDRVITDFNRRQELLDDVQSVYLDYKEQADAARIAVQKANVVIGGLQNEKSQLQYGLTVAVAYGDTMREADIRQRLAEIDGEIADATRDRAAAQAELNRTLKGDSAAAIDNRTEVRSMLNTYTSYLKSLNDAGVGMKKMNTAISTSKSEFLAWGKSMGFAESELAPYVALFDKFKKVEEKDGSGTDKTNKSRKEKEDLLRQMYDAQNAVVIEMIKAGKSEDDIRKYVNNSEKALERKRKELKLGKDATKDYADGYDGLRKALKEIPNNVTVKFSPDEDEINIALREWRAKEIAAQVKLNAPTSANASSVNKAIRGAIPKSVDVGVKVTTDADLRELRMAELALLKVIQAKNLDNPKRMGQTRADYVNNRIEQLKKMGYYRDGGFTGRGPANQVAGIVHAGEVVIPKPLVNQSTGVPFMMEQARAPQAGVQMMELSPVDRALLAKDKNLIVVMDGKIVGKIVDKNNVMAGNRGSN